VEHVHATHHTQNGPLRPQTQLAQTQLAEDGPADGLAARRVDERGENALDEVVVVGGERLVHVQLRANK